MIPGLAVMIGIYIWIRLLSFCLRKGERAEHIAVKIFSIIGLIIVPLICIGIVLSGVSIPRI